MDSVTYANHTISRAKGVLLKIFVLSILLIFLPTAFALQEFKDSAPETYVVKKGDTLWDIASLYLDEPWNWPVLWQNNSEIQNPHLIYPGDTLRLIKTAEGNINIELVRAEKRHLKLSPKTQKVLKSVDPLPTLPWSVIRPHIQHDVILQEAEYESLPYLLGNQNGEVRFATGDIVLGKAGLEFHEEFDVVRQHKEILNQEGEVLGMLVRQVASGVRNPIKLENEILVNLTGSRQEANRGDRLLPKSEKNYQEQIQLTAADNQLGRIVGGLQDHSLLGKYDVAVVDLGLNDVEPGVVMGVYLQGPDILDEDPISYESEESTLNLFGESGRIKQPALKVGEIIIFKTFERASFGLIVASTNVIKQGAYVGKP